MATKMTMIFQLSTNVSNPNATARRQGGWSETFYRIGAFTEEQRSDFIRLCLMRAQLLPSGASITGQRYQVVDPTGASSTGSAVFPGAASLQADIPQMALLCHAPAVGARNQRRIEIRGIPDARVVEGEYSPSARFTTALQNFFTQLGLFYFKGRDLSQAQLPIWHIDDAGLVTVTEPHTYTVGNLVRLLDVTNTSKDNVSGVYRISATTNSTQFTLMNWSGGSVNATGKVRLEGQTYFQIQSSGITISRIVTRKVGRPSVGYRGRVSTRR